MIQAVVRFDHKSAPKEIRPLRYLGEDKHGLPLFWFSAIEGQRPLYGLDELAKRPDAPVLVVEGEKTAEAAKLQFPDQVVITWMSGAGSVSRADLAPLAGRTLTIWPDNDIAGRKAGRLFAALALAAGADRAAFVDVPREFGDKWDLADEVPADAGAAYKLRQLLDTARPLSAAELEDALACPRTKPKMRRLLGHEPGHSNIELQVIEDALNELDPNMDRHTWQCVGRALYLGYAALALPVFDGWSKKSTEKYKVGEPAAMWHAYALEEQFEAKSLAWLMNKAAKAAKENSRNSQLDEEALALAYIEEVNKDHAFVIRGGKATVAWERYDPRFGWYALDYLTKQDFTAKLIRQIPLPSDDDQQSARKRKRMPLGSYWFGSPRRRHYDGVYFSPGKAIGKHNLNLWRGFAVRPVDNPAAWSKLKDHIFDHIAGGDQASFDYIMNWLAFGVQHLGLPLGVALVLIGPKGAGKSILTELYGNLFGPHKFVTAHAEDLFGRFNARLEYTLLLGIEEAFAPQNRGADGKLKDLLTRRELRLEDKFFSVWTAPNHLRIIMTSNNDRVVRADGYERRYAVFSVANSHQAHPDARRAYFGAMVEQMETGGFEAMLGELLARDITGWNSESIPETPALRRQKELNIMSHPVAAWLFERLCDGTQITLGNEQYTQIYTWSLTQDVFVPAAAVREDFLSFAKANNLPYSDRMLALKLPELMPDGFKRITRRDNHDLEGQPTRGYLFPPLPEARAAFGAKTGLTPTEETAGEP